MFRFYENKLIYFILTFLLTASSAVSRADDTEIFFGGGSSTTVRPNVLLILDTSGSMTNTVSSDPLNRTRMQIMKDAVTQVLNEVEDVNIGLMRFTNTEGGPVIFPITYIDAPASTVVSEPDDSEQTFNYTTANGNSDGEELLATTVVTLGNPTLRIAAVNSGGGGPTTLSKRVTVLNDAVFQENGVVKDDEELELHPSSATSGFVGVRFSGVNIPAGSVITSAFLNLWVETQEDSGNATINIKGHRVANSSSFIGGSGSDLSTRFNGAGTVATVGWTMANQAAGALAVDTGTTVAPNITTIINEIINGGIGWTSGNSLSILLDNTSNKRRDFESFGSTSNVNLRPQLVVTYTPPVVPAPAQNVGLHFPEVNIPQGAIVTNATLTFTASASNTPADGASWDIALENSDDAPDLQKDDGITNNGDISTGRTLTTPVTYVPPDFVAETPYTTANLSAAVQTVVNRGAWCGGNSMTVIIQKTPLSPDTTRNVYSFDGDPTKAPVLSVTYDATGPIGCFRQTETAQISNNSDDAEEDAGSMQITSGDLDIGQKKVGVRFQNIDVPQGATILSAFLEVRSDGSSTSGNPTINIKGEDIDDSPQFGSNNNNITSRTLTTANVNWTTGDWTADNLLIVPPCQFPAVTCAPDVSAIVKEIVDRPGWTAGNAMSFILGTGANNRPAESYDGNASQAPRLRITFESAGGAGATIKTVREKLIETVNALPASGYTPIVETLYEGAHYWRGETAVFGKGRDGSRTARISHPGSYCDAPGSCNGANVTTYPNFGVFYPAGCSDANLNSSNCINQEIRDAGAVPNYISPFSTTLTCQSNYQVLLTDGLANQNEQEPVIEPEFGVTCTNTKAFDLNGDGDTADAGETGTVSSGEKCGIDMAGFVKNVDQSGITSDQTVTTYTIGFNTASLAGADLFLQAMAQAGGGEWFPATDADDLVDVFEQILTDVKNDPTAFVAPTIATNQFNQLFSRDVLYFGMFTPELNQAWFGNLKRYQLCLDEDFNNDGVQDCTLNDILDGTGNVATDPVASVFLTSSKSFWFQNWTVNAPDEGFTTEGGAGAALTDFTDRIVYTDFRDDGVGGVENATSGTALNASGFQLTSTNWDATPSLDAIRDVVCPTPSTAPGSDCETRMLFMLGKIKNADPALDPSSTTRWSIHDVLHSSPAVITYGGADLFDDSIIGGRVSGTDGIIETFFDKILFGTNDGMLHFVNAETGQEEWVFIPENLMPNQQQVFSNPEGDHLYGMDLSPVIRSIDVDNDGQIEPPTDQVIAYAGMRRGGNFLYALDVTPTGQITDNTVGNVVPKFLWRIQGGINDPTLGNFTRMGDTWSLPVLATIRLDGGTTQDVLIFGGGYTNALDDATKFGLTATTPNDNLGNAIFIVNADTGKLLLSISGAGSGANITDTNMHFSIPAELTVFDNDGDGIEDRIYAADTGGQVWRVDLGSDILSTGGLNPAPTNPTVLGRLASISGAAPTTDQRRFYNRPVVVQVKDNVFSQAANGEFDYVVIGSGYRAHPLDTEANDRLYAFRDLTIGKMADADLNHIADGYPRTILTVPTPLGHAIPTDLVDVTTTVLDSSNTTHVASYGWYYDFDTDPTAADGEKVLQPVRILGGIVFFSSFQPEATNPDPCVANIGASRNGAINVLTAGATIDWDGDGDIDIDDRFNPKTNPGIVSEGVPVYGEGGVILIQSCGGTVCVGGEFDIDVRFRTFWHDNG